MTMQLGLIGYPLGHSLSPKIHKAALDACGLEGEYSLFSLAPDNLEGLKDLLARVRSGEINGLNVTIPHKQNVIPLLDEHTTIVGNIGAVNTIVRQNGKLVGENTDVHGFLTDLERFLSLNEQRRVQLKSALVFGAGGSARAVVYALVNNGWDVTINARRPQQALALIDQFPNPGFCLTSIESVELKARLPAFSLIVNTTPIGMSPDIYETPWPANLPFPPNASIYDLIYNPPETRLVKEARSAGLPATTGLGMLIEQAALAFQIWTKCNVPREPLFAAVEAL